MSRMNQIDEAIDIMFDALERKERLSVGELNKVRETCPMFVLLYDLMDLYVRYKFLTDRDKVARFVALYQTIEIGGLYPNYDIIALAQNFFHKRLRNEPQLAKFLPKLISSEVL